MRQVLLCFSLICTAAYAHAQETIYLGADSLPSSIADAKFKLVVQPIDSFPYHIQFFSLDSNQLLQEGPALDKSLSSRTGTWKGYLDDTKSYYFAQYAVNQLSGSYSRYYADSVLYAKGQYVAGKMEGTWQWFHENTQLASEEIWAYDSLVSITAHYQPNGSLQPEPWAVSVSPQPINLQVVIGRIEYPEEARKKDIEGVVNIRLRISPSGSILQQEVLKSVHPLLDAEASLAAARLIFSPGYLHNLPASFWVIAPINFKLE
jgi:TonB family protein